MNLFKSFSAGLFYLGSCCLTIAQKPDHQMIRADDSKLKEIETIWEKHIIDDSRSRDCDKAMGEEIGWLMSPFLQGFYYGYLATGDTKWVDEEVDWLDSWIKRDVI